MRQAKNGTQSPNPPTTTNPSLSKTSPNHPTNIINKRSRRLKRLRPTITRRITQSIIMAKKMRRIIPRPQRATLPIQPSLRTKRRVLTKQLRPIISIKQQHKARVPDKATRRVPRLKREARAVAQASAHDPAGLPLELVAAGRRDGLRVDGGAGMRQVPCCAAGRRDS